MFTPSGSLWIDVDPGAGRGKDRRGRSRRPRRWRSRGRCAGRTASRPRAAAGPRGSGRRGRARRRSRPIPAFRGPPSSSARQISCSRASSAGSSSLRPRLSRTLSPLSSAGLWDAETMTPAANDPEPARKARAGVGRIPTTWTSRRGWPRRPPATRRACSPERRVSWPSTIGATRAGQLVGHRPAQRVGQRRTQVDVGDAADPVGAEEAAHRQGAPAGGRRWPRRPARARASA